MSATTDSLNATNRILKRRLTILNLLNEKPLWKKRVAETLDESPQTIGRDIDALHRDELLEYTLVQAKDSNRMHYIAFKTTEMGEQALADYRTCTSCGDIVNPETDCVHEYASLTETNNPKGVLTE